ncbi:uncharacterized protein LOC124185299 isoform X1 [Neodiprion fabricii]|uniref:uncharacterized protein LOC124185299 isoform X1 n=1 Tax=Neodiprion fabricii TaxID=2872261 RepID=UPI001ED96FCB|nr:uncharacterized protein LOC124185299 isoform X1 [Neodiprion fabricii]
MTLKMDLASKCTSEYTPARFSARGIFITDNGYSCLICNIKIVNLVDSIKHVSKKEHCDKLHDMRIACFKVEGFVHCDICTNYVTENWKDFLIHFNQEHHFQSVKGNDNQHISYVSNVTLVNNYLIEQDPGYFFCLFCNALIIGDDSVFTHIREKKHVELLTTFTEKYPPEILFEAECRKWAKNFIYKLVQSEFYCTLCNNSIKGRRNCTKHITSDDHITKMVTSENIERQLFDNCIKRKQMLDSYGCPGFGTSKDPLDDAKAMCAANLMLQGTCTSQKFSARGTEQISSSIRVENMLTKDDLNYEPLCNEIKGKKKPGTTEVAYLQVSKNLLSESFDKIICENSITGPVPLTGHFICELCSCSIASRETVYEHISGHRHRRLRIKVDSMKSQEITNVYETFQDLSSSWESTESSLANWEVCETQSQGSNLFENSSSSSESCDKISNSWETISTSSSYSAQQASMMYEIPDAFMPLISENLLERRKGELYCVACEAHLRNLDSFLGHTNSKRHNARLKIYKTQISQKNNKLPATLQNNVSSNVHERSVDCKSFEYAKRVVDKPVSRPSKLLEVPQDLIPLISKHLLNHLEKEIYCKACDAHLLTPISLINHTMSKNHIARLSTYRDQIAQSSKKSSSNTSEDSRAPNTPVHTINKKPLQWVSKNLAKSDSQRSTKLLDVPKSLVSLITKHLLDHREKELYCKACDAHLLTPTSLIDHTTSKNHIARLSIYRDQIAQSSKKSSSSTSEDSRAPNTAVHPVNKKPLQSVSKNLAKAESRRSTKLLDVPKSLVSLITKHSLDHRKKELYCKACKAHLQSPSSIIAHTGSIYHITMLKYYRDQVWRKNETLLSTSEYSNATNASGPIISKDPLQSVLRSSEKPATVTSKNAIDVYRKVCKTHIETPEVMENNIKSEQHMENFESGNVQEKKKELYVNEMPSTSFGNSINKIKLPDSQSDIICKVNVQAEDSLSGASKTKKVRVRNKKKSNKSNRESQILELKCNLSWQETVVTNSKFLDNLREAGQNQVENPINHSKVLKKDRRKKAVPKYLHADMQHIYSMNPEKLRIIKLSCQLCFPKTSSVIYCLICQRSIPCKLQTFYEHICSLTHTANLAEMETNDQHFINCPDQFSDLTLAKELSQEISDANVQCFACDLSIQNDHADIIKHVTEDFHQERKQSWNIVMDKILQDILVQMKSTWYNIQKYLCQLCDIHFNTEFFFTEHLEGKKHQKCLKKTGIFVNRLIYDACISCATLWLGFPALYAQHCEQPLHKYLVQHGDYAKCVLPNQAKALLENAEAEVISLIALSDQVLNVQKTKVNSLLKCLEDTVKVKFPEAKAYPFGSRVSGLGFPESDIDVFLDCGTYDGKKTSKTYQIDIISSVENCLRVNEESWEIDEILVSTRTPIIKLHHRNTELSCDVSFTSGLSVENTKLLKCFIDNYPLCRQLMLFLKKWLTFCNLSGSRYITNYAICWYVIFYLQVESILPSVASLIAKENKSQIISNWETGICATFDVSGHEYTFTKLLYGFFVFYSNFDYRHSVVCPLLGRTILKNDFEDLNQLPKEMTPYVDLVKNSNDDCIELFRIDSEMCIQDPYDLSHNLTKAVPKLTLNRFKRLSAASADILKTFLQC